jgi:hypothetical protein
MPIPAALDAYNFYFPQVQQGSTGAVRIDTEQSPMSLSPWRGVEEFAAAKNSAPNYVTLIASGSQTSINFMPAEIVRTFAAKTPLGKRLVEIRQRAIAAGLHLLTEEEIRMEVERRRGENV